MTTKHYTILYLLQQASNQLSAVTDCAALEAEVLLAHALQKPRSYLHAFQEEVIASDQVKIFDEYLQRRLQQEPIAYIIGKREFWSLEFLVNRDTLIPRQETEILVESVLQLFPEKNEARLIADLGTGCGAIALALSHEHPQWTMIATDKSAQALEIAKQNAKHLNCHSVSFYEGSWCAALPSIQFDAIVSNPPYLSETEWKTYKKGLIFEPDSALVSGSDGLVAIREISECAKNHLKPGGYLLIEHGFSQGAEVRKIFASSQYVDVHSICDFSVNERVTIGCFPGFLC